MNKETFRRSHSLTLNRERHTPRERRSQSRLESNARTATDLAGLPKERYVARQTTPAIAMATPRPAFHLVYRTARRRQQLRLQTSSHALPQSRSKRFARQPVHASVRLSN